MISLFSTGDNFFLAERKISPASFRKLFLPVRKIFHFSRCCNAIFAFKDSLVRSLSREFSKYIKTFAAGFTLVQTVLHDVFAWVQSETIWFKIENVSEEKILVCVLKTFSKILWKTEQVSRLSK